MPEPLLSHYRSGVGHRLALLHPVGLDASSWAAFAAALGEGFEILAVDLPGHGKSPQSGETTLEDYADAVAATLDAIDFQPCAVMGLSFGGMIAQYLAVRRPELVSRLVLCGCAANFPDAVRSGIAARGAFAEAEGMQAVVTETLERWFTPEYLAQGGGEPVRARLVADDPQAWAAAWRAISALDTTGVLGTVKVPTYCVAGTSDAAFPPPRLQALTDLIPGAQFVAIEGASHIMHIENAADLAETVRPFLAYGTASAS